jgi:predicted amidohydrolase YtcJ
MDTHQPKTQAVAIANGRIIKVGSNQQITQLITNKTKVIDLVGKTVLPGLIDTHIHVADFGRCLMWLDLTAAKSITELQQMLKQKASETPAGKWIIGQGWNETRFKEKRMPTTADLDAAVPDDPVILYREAAMICAANTKAQKLAGVTEKTAAPQGGSIDKDSNGKLMGIFRDNAATLIWQAVPEPTVNDLSDATELALQKIIHAGITSIHWLVLSEVELTLIQRLHDQDKLPLRVNVVVPEALQEKASALKSADHLMLHFGGVTLNVDGYLDSKEAALIEPYSDDPNNSGKLLCTEENLKASVKNVLSAGIQPIILAMGDKAIDTALNVIEQTPRGDVRFRIEQAAVLNKILLQRLKQQQVLVSIQPKVITTEFSVWSAIERLGLERAKWLHPIKTLLNEGVKVVAGSDCPMEPLSAMLGIQELLLRPAFPEQRLTAMEALQMYTIAAAYSSNEETQKGSIEKGKLADLTVLSYDPSVVPPEKIKDITVETTIINGKLEFT